jgi:hypothetical protein
LTSPKFNLYDLSDGQAGKEPLINANNRVIEALAQGSVIDKDLTAPPGGESDGDTYIVGGSATGAWSGKDDDIAIYCSPISSYLYVTPDEGWFVWVKDENLRYRYTGSAWEATEQLLNNLSASAAPTVNDDADAGYSVGSIWIDTTADESYRCVDSSVGSADWINTTLTTDELGTAALEDKQTSAYDDTASRILALSGTAGSFGLGASILTAIADLNSPTTTRFDKIINTTSNRPFNFGVCLSIAYDANNMAQFAMETGGSEVWYRRKTSGTWQSWEQFALQGAAASFADLTATGDTNVAGLDSTATIEISNTFPNYRLYDSDGSADYRRVSFLLNGDSFWLQTRDDAGGLVSTDYRIFLDASGANQHSWALAGVEKLELTSNGLDLADGLLTLNGNDIGGESITIADDAVGSITPPRDGGFALVSALSGGEFPVSARSVLIYYDVGGSLQIGKCNIGFGAADVDVTASDVSGTTGTDTKTTIAVQSGVLKIENRAGGSYVFKVTFL